ncbi:MAG: type VI secretion system tip protein VgrG [Polyangiaceae bacterium]|nr:type VI secretion system tip protein VgrG [Polyangiaceae bacterium]
MNQARVNVETGDDLDVRSFSIKEVMSRLFRVELTVVSKNLDVDFTGIIGMEATFSLGTVLSSRSWTGVCVEIDQVRVDRDELATYTLAIAPRAYLLTQRKNYRIFQFKSELDIVTQLLDEWAVPYRVQVDGSAHLPRKFRVQYGESDFNFMSRMLEDAGISFFFEDSDGTTTMVLDDNPQAREMVHPGVPYYDQPGSTSKSFVTRVTLAQRTRPGRVTIGDLDYRRGSMQQPRLSAAAGLAQESRLEHFEYEPGAFLYQGTFGGNTPTADDRGASRTDEATGNRKTQNRLLGKRQDAKRVSFESDLLDLQPGKILGIANHPHLAVDRGGGLLVTSSVLEGDHDGDWRVHVDSVGVETPLRPEPVTPKPRVKGIESATVVGPSSDEIHTDEYARVRVHFHWDRESKRDDESSCWIPTNQPWAGPGFGGTVIPRIGQEVLVEFLGGDPDRPVVIGRVFTEHQPAPIKLPDGKTLTGLVGRSSPTIVLGGALSPANIYTIQGAGPGPQFRAKPPANFAKMHDPRGAAWDRTNNAFLLEDATGENLVFLQAEKDLHVVAKNSWKTVVGNYRGTYIGGNDTLEVRNKQNINVVVDQNLVVTGKQTITHEKDRTEWVGEDLGLIVKKKAAVECKGVINQKAKQAIILEAEEVIILRVGSSSITFSPKDIQIQSPKIDVNPDNACRGPSWTPSR